MDKAGLPLEKKPNAIFFRNFNNSYIPQIMQEIWVQRIYEPFLKNLKDATILDVGANIGLFSLYAKDYAKQVYALEPSIQHFSAMSMMLEWNEIRNVYPLKLALSNKNGESTFYHNSNVTMFSLRPEVNGLPNESEAVQTLDMETLCKTYDIGTIDFMKLDVEGSEVEILASESFEKVVPRIKAMVMEYHTWSQVNPQQVVNMLRDYGFKVEQIPSDATIFSAVR